MLIFSTEPKLEQQVTAFPPGTFGSKLEHFETNYLEYLHDARTSLRKCASACIAWVYPYDGEKPPPSSVDQYLTEDITGNIRSDSVLGDTNVFSEASQRDGSEAKDRETKEAILNYLEKKDSEGNKCDKSLTSAIIGDKEGLDDDDDVDIYHEAHSDIQDSKYDNMENFISMLEESDSPVDKTLNIEDSMKVLDSLISNMSISVTESRTSTPRREFSHDGYSSSKAFTAFCDNKEISSVSVIENSRLDTEEEKNSRQSEGTTFEIIDVTKPSRTEIENMTEFEVLEGPESTRIGSIKSKCVHETKNTTEFVEISMPTQTSIQNEGPSLESKKGDITDIVDPNLSNNSTESFKSIENWFGDSKNQSDKQVKTDINTTNTNTYPDGILVRKDSEKQDQTDGDSQEHAGSLKGDKSVRFAAVTSMQRPADILANPPAGVGISSLKPGTGSPTVGMYMHLMKN